MTPTSHDNETTQHVIIQHLWLLYTDVGYILEWTLGLSICSVILSNPLVLEVLIVHHVVEQDADTHCVPKRSESGVLAGDVLGSVGMDQPHGA